MKRLFIYSLSGLIFTGMMAFKSKPGIRPKAVLSDKTYYIKWDRITHDFGTVPAGVQMGTTFVLKNLGKSPVIILGTETSNISSTIVSYPKKPVLPGKSGDIEVYFNSTGKLGRQNKTITIVTNGERLILTIKCNIVESVKADTVPAIVWDKIEHDFGQIPEGTVAKTTYTVSNNRRDTLVIENVHGSCGCIVSDWSRVPVIPGAKSSIKVNFKAGSRPGPQNKSIVVYTNRGLFTLQLKAIIIAK